MKLLNIFKKENSKEVKNNIQKMDKKQLEKVIGGAEGDPIPGVGVNLGRAVSTQGVK
ncbi:MAG TPA: hypothetical protein PKZ75_14395 [Bacteroidia bacterium]|nr:hypothetical protein [Bacteroidia bacterium]